MKINLNEKVKVKLTDLGIKILKQDHDKTNELLKQHGGKGNPFILRLDEEGYYETQLWHLMSVFGQHLGSGLDSPFDMDLVLNETTDISKLKVIVQKNMPADELIRELKSIKGISNICIHYPVGIEYMGFMPIEKEEKR